MPEKIQITQVFQLQNTVFIDVRSEGEYAHAHIPGALNIPLLNNENRKEVGITYKQLGREAAVRKGFELMGHLFPEFYDKLRQAAENKYPVFYCWRGGLRSAISSSIYDWSGGKNAVIHGGYKAFRNLVLKGLKEPKKLLILSGFTGVGKTEILGKLKENGEQVIDLEALARHKGSALGALGMPGQYSNEMFENLLYLEWNKMDALKPTFIEAESRKIGGNILPENLWDLMQNAGVIQINLNREERLKRILNEYGSFSVDDLVACTIKIKKRLGGLNLKNAVEALESGDTAAWAGILMDYYDRTYTHSMKDKKAPFFELEWDWNHADECVKKLMEIRR